VIIPWRVDVPEDRYPFVNWLLVGLLAFVFVLQTAAMVQQMEAENEAWLAEEAEQAEAVKQGPKDAEISEKADPEGIDLETLQAAEEEAMLQEAFGWMSEFVLRGFSLKGLFGHMWLHAGLLHLAGNLLFLWIFGNAVCAKVGNRIYFPLYIVFGLIAGISHLLFTGGAVVGASGAINGVVGMFLVFFPENDITCYFSFTIFYWREFTVSSYWMILFWLFWDILGAVVATGLGASSGVAYFAHLGGFAVGFGIAILMLRKGWIHMERYEKSLLQLLSRKEEPSAAAFDPTFGLVADTSQLEKLAGIRSDEKPEVQASPKITQRPRASPPPPTVEQRSSTGLQEARPSQQLVRFMCPCGKRLKVPTKYAGKVGKCPKCGKRLRIPKGRT
jgi:membrane associated rhomboid family serine protease